ncbi:MAG: sulfotransferase family 2 domain-containing protein, partial [Cyclobacteriaceae bacterium]
MISHKHKAIFIHIPKCAGTSVEKLLGVGYNENSPDRCSLYGWDSEKQLHLHHATAEQLLDFGLIDEETWNSYFKFTFVRNPWDRAYSDYFWMMHDQRVKDSFDQFLLKKGAFYKCLNDQTSSSYRGDHMTCQLDYITVYGKIAVDYIGNVESFQNDLQYIGETIGLQIDAIPHNRKSNNLKFKHYS